MKKFMLATLALVGLLIASAGTHATPAAAAPRPAPQFGSCRFYCGNNPKPFTTRAACQAVCSTVCEDIC